VHLLIGDGKKHARAIHTIFSKKIELRNVLGIPRETRSWMNPMRNGRRHRGEGIRISSKRKNRLLNQKLGHRGGGGGINLPIEE